ALDLCGHDSFDRVAVLADCSCRGKGVVEVRSDLGSRAGLRHLMADAALLDKEDTPAGNVRIASAAARGGQGDGREGGEDEQGADGGRQLEHTALGRALSL